MSFSLGSMSCQAAALPLCDIGACMLVQYDVKLSGVAILGTLNVWSESICDCAGLQL